MNLNEPLPHHLTIGQKYEPAMAITDQDEADLYFDRLVEHTLGWEPELALEQAARIERSNLGYFAGYYGNETRERVERLFRCAHPVFGSIAANGPPSPEQALAAGLKMGREEAAG